MESENTIKEAYIDDTSMEEDTSIDEMEQDVNVEEEDAKECEDETSKDEDNSDEESTLDGEEVVPIFEREDWQDRVDNFAKEYPIAKEFYREIGECILEDDTLWSDDSCLDKALLRILSKQYVPDATKVKDEEFLANYIYNNEAIKDKIVKEYMDNFNERRLPSTMNRGGKISLADAKMPRSIKEAGMLAEKIMRR